MYMYSYVGRRVHEYILPYMYNPFIKNLWQCSFVCPASGGVSSAMRLDSMASTYTTACDSTKGLMVSLWQYFRVF